MRTSGGAWPRSSTPPSLAPGGFLPPAAGLRPLAAWGGEDRSARHPAWHATDVVAAFAYDLEAGRPDARSRAAQRLRDLVQQRDASLPRIATAHSIRRVRQAQPLPRPLRLFGGRYSHPGYGTIEFRVADGALSYRWGAISGTAEILDAATNTMRIELATTGTPMRFEFTGPGPASAVTLQGITFTRTGERE